MRPGNANAHYLAARSLRQSLPPDMPGTEEQFRIVLQLQPDHLDAHVWLAQAYDTWGRYEEAAILLERARELHPDHFGVLYLSGGVATRLGRDEEAVRHLQRALAQDSSRVAPYLDLGLALSHLGRNEEALAAYEEVIRRQPGNAQALQGAGTSLKRLGRDEEADRMLVRFRSAQDRDEEERKEGKRIGLRLTEVTGEYEAGRRDEARRRANLMREEFPGNASAFTRLGALQASMRDLEAAIHTFEKVLEFQPEDLAANYWLVELYSRAGDSQRSMDQKRRYDQLTQDASERRKQ
jgi:tetratricopeptide (TPR) repeat protein